MAIIIDKTSLDCAAEIIKSLGTAITDLQIYPSSHPRFKEAGTRIAGLVRGFFQKNPQSRQLLFVIKGDQIEFRKVPLINLDMSGEKLLRRLKEEGCEGLEFQDGIQAEDIFSLIQLLITRPENAGAAPPTAPDPASVKFKLYSKSASRNMSVLEAREQQEPGSSEAGKFMVPELQVTESTFRSILNTYRAVMANLGEGRSFNYQTLKQASDQVISIFSSNHGCILPSQSRFYFDDFTFHHSVNVSFLATSVAAMVVKDRDLLNQISIAALLHDIGKTRVPAEILHKPGKLTPAEFQSIQAHPVTGAEILLGIDDIDPLCVTIAYGHHITSDPGSYPKTALPYRCDWITDLICVVDIYEALTACRPYKKGLSCKTAFEVMLKMSGLQNRQPIIKMLFDRIGPFPIGTLVELTTRERAVVTEQNPSNPFLPRVTVLTDQNRKALGEPINFDMADPEQQKSRGGAARIKRTFMLQSAEDDPLSGDLLPEPDEILGAPLNDDKALMTREG